MLGSCCPFFCFFGVGREAVLCLFCLRFPIFRMESEGSASFVRKHKKEKRRSGGLQLREHRSSHAAASLRTLVTWCVCSSISVMAAQPPYKRRRGRPSRDETVVLEALRSQGLLGQELPALPSAPPTLRTAASTPEAASLSDLQKAREQFTPSHSDAYRNSSLDTWSNIS